MLKLWLAVIHRAALDLLRERGDRDGLIRQVRHRTARAWFESDCCEIGAFLWCADVVGIDGPSFRRQLLRRADRNNGAEIDPWAAVHQILKGFSAEKEKAAV